MISEEFGQLHIGDKRVSPGRTITETDVVHYCMLTGNWLAIHSDTEYAKTTRFGQRVVQGGLVYSIVHALIPFDPEVVEAFYGADKLRFLAPTFIGDTLHATTEISALRDKGSDHGVATMLLCAINQNTKKVMSCEFSLLVRRERLRMDVDARE
jgi:acyl dehydratase